jgi:hypothetical protein
MKKILIFLLTLILCVSAAGCGKDQSAQPQKDNSAIGVDKSQSTVELTLPASAFEDQDLAAFDTNQYVKKQGFINAKVNDDGSVTVSMTGDRYKKLLADMQADTEGSFQDLIKGEAVPYIKSITHDEGFKTVTVEIDRAEYDKVQFPVSPLSVGVIANYYQEFVGSTIRTKVIFKDVNTGEVISTTICPDDMKNGGTAN